MLICAAWPLFAAVGVGVVAGLPMPRLGLSY
jgi:hypothetical protein